MLLFVIAALTIFHFALPHGTSDSAALGLLWSALIFTALLGLTRAFVAEREQGHVRRAHPHAVRPQRDLARQGDRGARVSRRGRGRRAAGVRRVLLRASTAGRSQRSRSPTSGSPRSERSSARWRSPGAPASCCCRCSSCRRRSRSSSAASAATCGSSCSMTRSSRCSPGRRSSTSSLNSDRAALRWRREDDARREPCRCGGGTGRRAAGSLDRTDLLLCADRRRPGLLAADLLLPRSDRPHRVRLLRLGRLEGAARTLRRATSAPTSRATSRSTRA